MNRTNLPSSERPKVIGSQRFRPQGRFSSRLRDDPNPGFSEKFFELEHFLRNPSDALFKLRFVFANCEPHEKLRPTEAIWTKSERKINDFRSAALKRASKPADSVHVPRQDLVRFRFRTGFLHSFASVAIGVLSAYCLCSIHCEPHQFLQIISSDFCITKSLSFFVFATVVSQATFHIDKLAGTLN